MCVDGEQIINSRCLKVNKACQAVCKAIEWCQTIGNNGIESFGRTISTPRL